ncbi:MAG: sodium:alanine symporter family protein [Oscillospiraceae bacterium]|nr:sodium:alanine symporter family protein [Oscillospiraceae bacterium]
MEGFFRVERALNSLVWGPATVVLLLATGLYLSLRCGFPQLRHLGLILRQTAGSLLHRTSGGGDGRNLSPFQAMTAALAGTVGTGNIAGVAGAILTGGPGAVFWMWVSALLGMCTKFVEITLALRWRDTRGGVHRGGPMYYITLGLGPRFRPLAALFALAGTLASFGVGNLVQSSEIGSAMAELFGIPQPATGLALAVLTAAVLFGGVGRIGRVTEKLVPLMAGIYILAALAVLILRIGALPAALGSIFREAFSLRAAGGGIAGTVMARALRTGLSRGVFSNEAGLGSAPIAHAASDCTEPCRQAMWGVFEVFIDTFVICTLTALVLLFSGVTDGAISFPGNGAAAAAAFDAVLPCGIGGALLRLCLALFALSTIFGWSCYGGRCWAWLTGERSFGGRCYALLFSLVCIPGAIGAGARMWELADTLNGLMLLPNLTALLLLSGEAARMTKDYFRKQHDGKTPGPDRGS